MQAIARVRIVVADGREAVREGLTRLLAAEPDFDVIVTTGSVAALATLPPADAFDVAIVAGDLPGGLAAAVREVQRIQPAARLVILARPGETAVLTADLDACAPTVVDIDAGIAALIAALRALQQAPASAAAPERAPAAGNGPPLTAREREILLMIAAGSSNARIAALTSLSPHTVRAHLRSIARKLGVRNRAHAVSAAVQSGQIHLDRAS